MFKIGQSIVHKSHGVGKIVGIDERDFNNGKGIQRFYICEIQDNGAPKKVFVPFESERLRKIIGKNEVKEVYALLSNSNFRLDDCQTWNRRYREYMELLHTGEINNLALVLKALFTRMKANELSFGERKMLEQAKMLLVKELSLAENTTEEEIEKKLFGFHTEGLL